MATKSITSLAENIFLEATTNKTYAQSVKSSINKFGQKSRLDSIYAIFPKMVMVERNRHRCFSLSDRSSRAVPPEKLIQEIRSGVGLAMPAKFKARAKGMSGGEEFTGSQLILCQMGWIIDALHACDAAEQAMFRDEAKETVNRRLDPYIYAHTLQTGTFEGWLNFFGLRLHSGADPTIQLLAQKTFHVFKGTTPQFLKPGEWHLPFINNEDWENCPDNFGSSVKEVEEVMKMLSASRCAHLSYNDLETGAKMTTEKGLSIYKRLIESSPIHASPAEHQAMSAHSDYFNNGGNLGRYWTQARKHLPSENIAPLPEGYEL